MTVLDNGAALKVFCNTEIVLNIMLEQQLYFLNMYETNTINYVQGLINDLMNLIWVLGR